MIAPRRGQALAEVVLCSGFPTQLALTAALDLAGFRPLAADGSLSLSFVALVSAGDTILLLTLITWLLVRRGESPREVFLGYRPPSREALIGLALAPLVLAFIIVSMLLMRTFLPGLHNVPENPLEALARTAQGFVILLVVAMVAGGVREEIQRAFLLRRFATDLGGARLGLGVTSIAFGLGH